MYYNINKRDWCIFFLGMFMVNYDEVNWRLLIDYLGSPKRDEVPSITRAKLLHDAWNLALGGELSFLVPLDLTKQMQKQEYSPAVWHVFMTMREHVTRMLAGTAHCTPLEVSKLHRAGFRLVKALSYL